MTRRQPLLGMLPSGQLFVIFEKTAKVYVACTFPHDFILKTDTLHQFPWGTRYRQAQLRTSRRWLKMSGHPLIEIVDQPNPHTLPTFRSLQTRFGQKKKFGDGDVGYLVL